MRATLLTFALLFASTAVYADKVYKWVDAQGNVLYTDQPRNGAQEIKIVASRPAGAPRASEATPRQSGSFASVEQEPFRYSVTLSAPTNEETIRDNDGNVTVALRVAPGLRGGNGDRIKLALDGSVLDTDVSPPGIVLAGLDQGSHTLQATLTDGNGRVLVRSELVTFYLKHWSLDDPTGPGTYPPTYPRQPYPVASPAQPYRPVYPPSGVPKPGR